MSNTPSNNEMRTIQFCNYGLSKYCQAQIFYLRFMQFFLAIGSLFTLAELHAQTPPKPPVQRELYIPFDDLPLVLSSPNQRIMLTREEYDDLRKRSGKSQVAVADPFDAIIRNAKYQAQVTSQYALISGTISVESLKQGPLLVPLDLNIHGLKLATINEAPASIVIDGDGKPNLVVETKGEHTLRLEIVTPVSTTASQQIIDFQVPVVAQSSMELRVPGNVEIKSGSAVLERQVDSDDGKESTSFDLLLQPGPNSIHFSLNNRVTQNQASTSAQLTLIDTVRPGLETLSVTATLNVPNGNSKLFRFNIPEHFEVTDVTAELLSRWSIVQDDEGRKLFIELREAAVDQQVLSMTLVRSNDFKSSWSFPVLNSLDVDRVSSIVLLRSSEGISLSNVVQENLFPVDEAYLKQLEEMKRLEQLETQQENVTTNPNIQNPNQPTKVRAAFYAPTNKFHWSADIKVLPPSFQANATLALSIGNEGLNLNAQVAITPANAPVFATNLRMPKGWFVTQATFEDGSQLAFQQSSKDNEQQIRIEFSRPIQPGTTNRLTFLAKRIPDEWLRNWDANSVEFPKLTIESSTKSSFALAVIAVDDLDVFVQSMSNMTSLFANELAAYGLTNQSAALSFRTDFPDWTLDLTLRRNASRITSRWFHFVNFQLESTLYHSEVVYQVQQAAADRFTFSLPDSTPNEISILGPDNQIIKETSSQVKNGRRVWQVRLAQRMSGAVRLTVDFQQNFKADESIEINLLTPKSEDVAYQSGTIAIEANGELEVSVLTHPREADIGQLIDAQYQVGKRLIGVYGYIEEDDAVSLKIAQRVGHALPTTIVRRAELISQLSPNGKVQTIARYQLLSKGDYITASLPNEGSLWSVLIDGTATLPQRDGEQVIVQLPVSSRADQTHNLHIIFETPSPQISWRSDVSLFAPRLSIRKSDQREEKIPLGAIDWVIAAPSQYKIVKSEGTLFTTTLDSQPNVFNYMVPKLYLALSYVSPTLPRNHNMSLAGPANEAYYLDGSISSRAEPNKQSITESDFSKTVPPASLPTPNRAAANTSQPTSGLPGIGGPAVTTAPMPSDTPAPPASPASEPASVFSTDKSRKSDVNKYLGDRVSPQPDQQGQTKWFDDQTLPSSSKKELETRGKGVWALQGLRSLPIEFTTDSYSQMFTFSGLGEEPDLSITLMDTKRHEWLAAAVASFIILFGILLTSASPQLKWRFFLTVFSIAAIAPSLFTWSIELVPVCVSALYALVLVVCIWLVRYLLQKSNSMIASYRAARSLKSIPPSPPMSPPSTTSITTLSVLWLTIQLSAPIHAQEEVQPKEDKPPIATPSELELDGTNLDISPFIKSIDRSLDSLSAEKTVPTIVVPHDTIVVPYRGTFPGLSNPSDEIFVPFISYKEMRELVRAKELVPKQNPPVSILIRGAQYKALLIDGNQIELTGSIEIESFIEEGQTVSLPFSGGILKAATLDGTTVSLKEVDKSLQIYVSKRGTKRLNLTILFPLQRRSGWRILNGIIPASPATNLHLTVPNSGTEIRSRFSDESIPNGFPQRANSPPANQQAIPQQAFRQQAIPQQKAITTFTPASTLAYESTRDQEQIDIPIFSPGKLNVQWRSKIVEAVVDQGLHSDSSHLIDVEQAGLRWVWRVSLTFRNGQHESLRAIIPPDYLLESVTGENIKGWKKEIIDQKQYVELTFLKPATAKETFTVRAFLPSRWNDKGNREKTVPVGEIEGAMVQQGEILIRKEELIELRTVPNNGVTRMDLANAEAKWVNEREKLPIQLKPFQQYRFQAVPYRLSIVVTPLVPKITTEAQTILRTSSEVSTFESRIVVSQTSPIYRVQIIVPNIWDIPKPALAIPFDWSIDEEDDERKVIDIRFGEGQVSPLPIVITGTSPTKDSVIPLPNIVVRDAEKTTGTIVIQSDRSFEVKLIDAVQITTMPLSTVGDWLQALQRSLSSLAVQYRQPNYSGKVSLKAKTPAVSGMVVSNVKVTDLAIEETVLIEWTIKEAGINRLVFDVPVWMKDAIVKAPMVKRVDRAPSKTNNDMIEFSLDLQEEIIGQYRIIIESDRPLLKGIQNAGIPILITGKTDRRYVTLENAGRDEIVIRDQTGLTTMNRQSQQWRSLADVLGGQAAQAFFVEETGSPILSFEAKGREQVKTAEARIGIARTTIVVDESGAFRATQEYRMENRSEPYLEIKMPVGAKLWTAHVANQPVKPIAIVHEASSNAVDNRSGKEQGTIDQTTGNQERIRIPLVKTEKGDLDYGVVLKFGGQIENPQKSNRIHFPFIQTVNINVELSQATLSLPKSMQWYNFLGSMRLVQDRREFDAGWLSFKTKQVRNLTEILKSESSLSYSRSRAAFNLQQLEKNLNEENTKLQIQGGTNSSYQQEFASNSFAIEDAKKELSLTVPQEDEEVMLGNRSKLQRRFLEQRNGRAKNTLDVNPNNFDVQTQDNQLLFESEVVGKAAKPQPAEKAGEKGGAMAGESAMSQARRYQQTLEAKQNLDNLSSLTGSNSGPKDAIQGRKDGMMGGGMGGGMGGVASGQVTDRLSETNLSERKRENVESSRSGRYGHSLLADDDFASSNVSGLINNPQAAATGHLASLDVDIPSTGMEYFFTTPRGNAEISASCVSYKFIHQIRDLGISIGVIFLVALSPRLLRRRQVVFQPTTNVSTDTPT